MSHLACCCCCCLAAGEKQNDSSSWSSSHTWSSSRRDGDTKSELGLSSFGEGRVRSGLASSLCRFKVLNFSKPINSVHRCEHTYCVCIWPVCHLLLISDIESFAVNRMLTTTGGQKNRYVRIFIPPIQFIDITSKYWYILRWSP